MTCAREPGHVAGVTDDQRSADRADAIDVGDGGARGDDRDTDALDESFELVVDAVHVAEKLERNASAFDVDERGPNRSTEQWMTTSSLDGQRR